jgi:hypothetical protein
MRNAASTVLSINQERQSLKCIMLCCAVLCLQSQDNCRKCHSLLHEKGARQYAAHRYHPAIDLLKPAVFFATSVTAEKSARLLAMALLKLGQLSSAIEYVGVAEQQEGVVSATGCLTRLAATLQLQAQARAAAAGGGGGGAAAAAAVTAADGEGCEGGDGLVAAAVEALASVDGLTIDAMQVGGLRVRRGL